MFSTIKKMIFLLDRQEKIQAAWLIALMLFLGFVEVAGVASIMPFIAVLADPDIVQHSQKLREIYTALDFSSTNSFLVALGGLVLIALTVANVVSALTQRSLTWFTYMRSHTLSRRLLIHYLNQPYLFFVQRNSAEMAQNVLNEVTNVVRNILVSIMQSAARIIVNLCIFSLLIAVDPLLTVIVFVVLGGAYCLVYMLVRKQLGRVGRLRIAAAAEKHKAIAEIFAGIKDLKVRGREKIYLDRYDEPSIRTAQYQTIQENISAIPRFIIETITFGGILIIVLYLMLYKGGLGQALPIIGLFAFAGQRMMPGMQAIFVNATKIRFASATLDRLVAEIGHQGKPETLLLAHDDGSVLPLDDEMRLTNLNFAYPAGHPVLRGLNLTIKARTTVGFVGASGAGKTTLIDIMLGLLRADSGEIHIDGRLLTPDNTRAWQNALGYVSQNIVLLDDTIASNIASGLPDSQIDMDAVRRAARLSHLDHFVENELENGYRTRIGENGLRLSGGQRQRIGIARALYTDPSLIIFDEATSALDNLTEQAVIGAVRELAHQKTIIMIAHRLTTVQNCDVIHFMADGQVMQSGTYDMLMETCPAFRKLAQASETGIKPH